MYFGSKVIYTYQRALCAYFLYKVRSVNDGAVTSVTFSINDAPCYRPQRSWGKVMFLQASVILLTGGVPDTPPDLEQTPLPGPGADNPPGPATPPPRDQAHPPCYQVHPPWDQIPPGTRYNPLGPGTPPWTRYTPPTQSMLGDTVNERAVRILLECNLVKKFFRTNF